MIFLLYEYPHIMVYGDTRQHKETLRFLGFRWDPTRKHWYRYAKGLYVSYFLQKLKNMIGENIMSIDPQSLKSYDKLVSQATDDSISYRLGIIREKARVVEE